jgi:hypothetical protein
MNKKYGILTDFAKGIIVGFLFAVIIFGVVAGLLYIRNKNKELIQYVERQIEIEALREDYVNRDVDEFLEIPDVRRASDGAAAEFERRRDEILYRFRNRLAD